MPELFFKPEILTKMSVSKLMLASEVPEDCDIYVFYVPGMLKYEDLKKALLDFGQDAGKTIFVGVWSVATEAYKKVITYFKTKNSPAVVVSAKSLFATNPEKPAETAFARIDNPNLLNDLARASECITET